MIMVTGDESLATKYIGENSRFPDVRSSHYAYNAISLMVDRGMSMPDAFRESSRLTGGNRWMVIGLYLVLSLINLAGILMLCVGLIFALPLTTVAWAAAYKWMLNGPDALNARVGGG